MTLGTRLRYHQATFDLLGIAPRVRDDAESALDARESALGFALPPSVREFYGQERASEVLRTLYAGICPAGLDDLKPAKTYDEFDGWKATPDDFREAERWYTILPRDGEATATRHGYGAEPLLQVMAADKWSCRWAVRLDASDDPEVLVEDVDADAWRLASASYSTFILAGAWDLGLAGPHGKLGGPPPSAEAMAFLRGHYREGPRTFGCPGDWQLRFSGDDVQLRISKLCDCDWADWLVAGCSREAVAACVRRLAPLTGLSDRIEEWELPEDGPSPEARGGAEAVEQGKRRGEGTGG